MMPRRTTQSFARQRVWLYHLSWHALTSGSRSTSSSGANFVFRLIEYGAWLAMRISLGCNAGGYIIFAQHERIARSKAAKPVTKDKTASSRPTMKGPLRENSSSWLPEDVNDGANVGTGAGASRKGRRRQARQWWRRPK